MVESSRLWMAAVNGRARPGGELVVTGVPIDSIGAAAARNAPFGTELAPQALRSAGLIPALGAADGGDIPTRIVARTRDPATGVVGWPSVAKASVAVRARVAGLASDGKVPVLIGGC
jgi:arginase